MSKPMKSISIVWDQGQMETCLFAQQQKVKLALFLQSDIWKKAKQEPIDIARDAHGSHRKGA